MNSNDLRVKRTLEAIKEAFIELVDEYGFDKLTVRDITIKANINRGTFYAHYQDKYDLLEKYEEQLITDISQFSPFYRTDELKETFNTNDSISFTIPIFHYIKKHFKLVRTILKMNQGINFKNKMKQFLLNEFIAQREHSVIREDKLLIPKEYLLAYTISAHMGLMIEWMERDCIDPPEQVAHMLWTLAKYGTLHVIGINNGE